MWDNIRVFLVHTHHSLSPLLSVLSCSHSHLSSWLFLSSFLLPTTHFSPLYTLVFQLTHSFGISLVKSSIVELNHYTFLFAFLFSLTPKWFPTEFFRSAFYSSMLFASLFVRGQGWGWSANPTIPHSRGWGLQTSSSAGCPSRITSSLSEPDSAPDHL